MSEKMRDEIVSELRHTAGKLINGEISDGDIAASLLSEAAELLASSPAQEPVTTEPVAWLCTDDRYPVVNGIVTVRAETVAAWRAGEIKFVGLGPAIPAPPQPGRDANDKHYLAAIRHHLNRLYSVYPNNARLREQISNEIDWIDATLTGEPK